MRTILLLVLFVLFPCAARAGGSCPPGQYPIGGEGVQGCAPVPGGGAGENGASPRPTEKWEARWGAIAECKSYR